MFGGFSPQGGLRGLKCRSMADASPGGFLRIGVHRPRPRRGSRARLAGNRANRVGSCRPSGVSSRSEYLLRRDMMASAGREAVIVTPSQPSWPLTSQETHQVRATPSCQSRGERTARSAPHPRAPQSPATQPVVGAAGPGRRVAPRRCRPRAEGQDPRPIRPAQGRPPTGRRAGIGRQVDTSHERVSTTRCGTSGGTHRKGQVSPGMVAAVVDSAVVRPGQLSSGPRLLGNASPAMAPGLSDHDWSVSEYIGLPLHVSELDRVIYQEQCEVLESPLHRDHAGKVCQRRVGPPNPTSSENSTGGFRPSPREFAGTASRDERTEMTQRR